MYQLNSTHDPKKQSWIESANDNQSRFPIQHLPFVSFQPNGLQSYPRLGVGIGEYILDLSVCAEAGLLDGPSELAGRACLCPSLNELMTLGFSNWSALRLRISELLCSKNNELRKNKELCSRALILQGDTELFLGVEIGDFTDFYASRFHASRVGALFRPEEPLLPCYLHLPIAYHGRSSSIISSETKVRRPVGQINSGAKQPVYTATSALDFELELAAYIGTGNKLGQPVSIERAEELIFGVSLLNDWSARDIQLWEGRPLGPFLSKNFATSVSPWITPLEALVPFRGALKGRLPDDPHPLAYLFSQLDQSFGAIDLKLEAKIVTPRMKEENFAPVSICKVNFNQMYWSFAQMVAHHTSSGCNLLPGDLIASGTVSGSDEDLSCGCLLEKTAAGSRPFMLPSGETRTYLEDGDEIILCGICERENFASITLGECRAIIAGAYA
jgi:fumarylacetoacetase